MSALAKWTFILIVSTGAVGLLVSDFVPSRPIVIVAEILGTIAGLGYGVLAAFAARNPRVAELLRTRWLLSKAYIRAPLTALMTYLFAVVSFSSALPWAINAVIGTPGSAQATVEGWERGSSRYRHCDRPTLTGLPFGTVGRRAMCDLHLAREALPPGTHIRLTGKSSVLGISPDTLEILSEAR